VQGWIGLHGAGSISSFFRFLPASGGKSGLLKKKNMISDGDGGNNIDDLGKCK
jgi:hypothetical protein